MFQPIYTHIRTQLLTLTYLENVFQALPYIRTSQNLYEAFKSTIWDPAEVIQAWEVTNPASYEQLNTAGNAVDIEHTIQIQGFLTFDVDDPDTSSQQMQTWVDAIKLLFLQDNKLGKTVTNRSGLRLLSNESVFFFERLCHHCVFEFTATTTHSC